MAMLIIKIHMDNDAFGHEHMEDVERDIVRREEAKRILEKLVALNDFTDGGMGHYLLDINGHVVGTSVVA